MPSEQSRLSVARYRKERPAISRGYISDLHSVSGNDRSKVVRENVGVIIYQFNSSPLHFNPAAVKDVKKSEINGPVFLLFLL